ncbi:hexokinase-4-like [Littorina saxatilis]|uniref:hexokinase-4-like n=1 Tax=Littorina saxatilis TaxID=31220 RepID=UPI0038B59279
MQRHHCDVEIDGYTFNSDSHSAIAVKIASVRDEFAGLYVCYLVPSDGTQAHPCELIVRGGRVTLPQTTTPVATVKKNETWMIGFIVVLITAVIAVAASGLCAFYWRRRSLQRPKIDDYVELRRLISGDGGNDSSQGQEDLQETTAYPDKRIMVHLKRFLVGPEQIETLMKAVQKELDDYSTPQTTSSNMFCTTVQALPNKTETGDVLVMNLNSICLKVIIVKLRGEDINADEYMTYKIPADVRTGTSNQLMDFIADRVSMFLKIKDLLHKSHSVGFVLSFPCKYDISRDLTTARLAKWTKGFCCKDVEDKKWRELLQQAFKKKNGFYYLCSLASVSSHTDTARGTEDAHQTHIS